MKTLSVYVMRKPSGAWVAMADDDVGHENIVGHGPSEAKALEAFIAKFLLKRESDDFAITAIHKQEIVIDVVDTTTPLGYAWHVWPGDYDLGMKPLQSGFASNYAEAEKRAYEVAESIENHREF